MTLDVSTVIKVNIYTIFRNAINFYFWDGKDPNKTIEQSFERYAKGEHLNKDLNRQQVKELFNSYIEKCMIDCSKIYKEDKERSFDIKSFKDFCDQNGMPFKNIRQMQTFVNQNFELL